MTAMKVSWRRVVQVTLAYLVASLLLYKPVMAYLSSAAPGGVTPANLSELFFHQLSFGLGLGFLGMATGLIAELRFGGVEKWTYGQALIPPLSLGCSLALLLVLYYRSAVQLGEDVFDLNSEVVGYGIQFFEVYKIGLCSGLVVLLFGASPVIKLLTDTFRSRRGNWASDTGK